MSRLSFLKAPPVPHRTAHPTHQPTHPHYKLTNLGELNADNVVCHRGAELGIELAESSLHGRHVGGVEDVDGDQARVLGHDLAHLRQWHVPTVRLHW